MLATITKWIMSIRGMLYAKDPAAFKRHLTTFLSTLIIIGVAFSGFLWTTAKPWAEDFIKKSARTESMVSITEFDLLKNTVNDTSTNVDALTDQSKALADQSKKLTDSTNVLTIDTNQLKVTVTDLVKAQQQLSDLIKQQQMQLGNQSVELGKHATQLDDIKDLVGESRQDIKTLLQRPALPPILAPGSSQGN